MTSTSTTTTPATTTTSATPFTSRPTTERALWYLDRSLMTILATAEETNGQFGLVLVHTRADGAPPPHTHQDEDETFYVLEGEATIHVGDETFNATPGTCVFMPRGIEHSFTIDSEEAKALVLITPGGFEGYFRELSVPAPTLTLPPPPAGPPDIARVMAVSAKYGTAITPLRQR